MKMSQLVEVNFIIVAGELYDTFSRSRSIVETGGIFSIFCGKINWIWPETEEFWKSVNICLSYNEKSSYCFLRHYIAYFSLVMMKNWTENYKHEKIKKSEIF